MITLLFALFSVQDIEGVPTHHVTFATMEDCTATLVEFADHADAICIQHLFPPRPQARPTPEGETN